MNELLMRKIYNEAHEAGMKAGNEAFVVPMTVQQHANPLDDNSAVVYREFVADGVCGFAWINVSGREPFGKYCMKIKMAIKGYPKGIQISCREFGQSMQRKYAYAIAFAKVLNENYGIKAYATQRID